MWKDWRITKWISKRISTNEAPASKSSKSSIIKKLGISFGGTKREKFQGPEGFEFEQIERAYFTDSYIRMAVDKYIDFMFKAGWDLTGKNPKTVEYIKQRLAAMAQATQNPTDQLFIDIAEDLIKYHNVFLVKARQPNGYVFPTGIRATPLDGQKPVVGYFPLPVSTITIDREINGNVRRFKQEVEGGEDPLEIKPQDLIHIYVDKQPGRAFGFPFLWEVLDDVKMLRQLEELVDRMIYKNIFPLLVYQVGLPEDGFQATDEEIEAVKEALGEMTLDGGMVLPERHNIKNIGAEGKALEVQGYLQYFEKRVFTGLGVSETMMGRGDTANRSTSDNMDAAFKDRVKAYQKIMATFINNFIVNELLLEGGYDPIMQEQDKVFFTFREIDFDSKIKEENHAIQKFTQNAITHEELRMVLGLDPVADESRLYFQMVQATLEEQKAKNNQSANAVTPKNQHSSLEMENNLKESMEIKESVDEFEKMLYNRWEMAKIDTIEAIRRFYSNNPSGDVKFNVASLDAVMNLTATSLGPIINKSIKESFMNGAQDAKLQANSNAYLYINYDYNAGRISEQIAKNLKALLTVDLVNRIDKALDESDRVKLISNVVGAFDALRYRLKFLANTETSKSYMVGFSRAARMLGHDKAIITVGATDDDCQLHAGEVVNLLSDRLPPFHPNCTCKLTLIAKEGS